MSGRPTPLRRELLGSFAVLFAGALVLAGVGLLLVYPFLGSAAEALFYLGALLVVDLAVLFVFGRALLRRTLLEPVDRLVEDTRRIADGDYRHGVRPSDVEELQSLADSVHAMADRLIRDQRLLAENVESLERTNRELVRTRDQLVQAARLASVGTLSAGIAHEVGNPLGAIFTYVDAARARAKEAGMDTEILDDIRDEARRIDRIIRGLLDYARPEEQEPGPTRPGDVLERVRDLLDAQGHLDDVSVTWTVEDGVPPVHVDPHRLEHVLVNLFLNAADALEGRGGGRIRARVSVEPGMARRLPVRREEDPPEVNYAHRRRVAPEQDGGEPDPLWTAEKVVVLTVEDDGPGLPEEEVDRLFDPFYTTKEPGKGTGLGLSICARLVDGMSGRIEAENHPEGGARFTIRLPGRPGGAPEAGGAGGSGEASRDRAGAGTGEA